MSSTASTPAPTATPRRQARPSTDTNSDSDSDSQLVHLQRQLPPYEPPVAPLTPACQRALTNLLQSDRLKALHTHVQHAGESVSDAAGEVNEKLTDARVRHERYLGSLRKRRERGDGGEDADNDDGDGEADVGEGGREGSGSVEVDEDEAEHQFRTTETEITILTKTLEEEIRRVVDSEVMLENLKGTLGDLSREAEEAGSRALASRRRARQSRRRRNADPDGNDDDEADEDYDDAEEEEEHGEEDENRDPPSQQLAQKLESSLADWTAQSLTQRYANNNTYIGFYRMVHDAKHPGNDIPPIPHSSTWFRHLEDPAGTTGTTATTGDGAPSTSSHAGNAGSGSARKRTRHGARRSSPADDEEVAIAHERISLKCPLTLLPFTDPLTSTKCPHSFEKEAILDMLNNSATTTPAPPGAGRNRRVKAVKCPVCEVLLSAEDLKRDVVLVRRVKRMQELMARADEDDDDDEEDDEGGDENEGGRKKRSRKGRQSGITLASDEDSEGSEDSEDSENENSGGSDDETEGSPVRIKQEKALSQAL